MALALALERAPAWAEAGLTPGWRAVDSSAPAQPRRSARMRVPERVAERAQTPERMQRPERV
jgi:hypothetical protein